MSFRVCSFWTDGTPYERVMHETLAPSLKKFDVPFFVQRLPNHGHWAVNGNMKPAFLRDCMDQFPSDDIVWLDADAQLMGSPRLFDQLPTEVDFAARFRPRGQEGTKRGAVELLSGTLFFRQNETARDLLDRWMKQAIASSKVWDQKNLYQAVQSFRWVEFLGPDAGSASEFRPGHEALTYYDLPKSYCFIRSLDREEPIPPVVFHWQASRWLKKKVGGS